MNNLQRRVFALRIHLQQLADADQLTAVSDMDLPHALREIDAHLHSAEGILSKVSPKLQPGDAISASSNLGQPADGPAESIAGSGDDLLPELARHLHVIGVGRRLPLETLVRILQMISDGGTTNAIYLATNVHHKTIGRIRASTQLGKHTPNLSDVRRRG